MRYKLLSKRAPLPDPLAIDPFRVLLYKFQSVMTGATETPSASCPCVMVSAADCVVRNFPFYELQVRTSF